MIGRLYFARQARTLLAYAKTTKDPNLAAVLLERAADLTAKAEEFRPDVAPRAPDVEPVEKSEKSETGGRHRVARVH